jgi:protein PhnA
MVKRLEKHQQRVEQLDRFGKDLARRSGRRCELCGSAGVKLKIHEVPPIGQEPDFDRCILICETCQQQIDQPKRMDSNHWHCLSQAAWSDIPAVQVMAVLLLRQLPNQDWARELLEQLYLTPETEAWLAGG